MRIPTETDCYRLMAGMAMLDNIAAHSIRVCQVAAVLAVGLETTGHGLDRNLVQAAALLHDITKTRSLSTSENHACTGADYLREQGYPEVGAIVGQHVKLADFNTKGEPSAAEVVNYADKRVMHDKVVSLDVRMADLMKRYNGSGQLGNRLDLMRRQAREIETKLFAVLPFSEKQVIDHLDPDDYRTAMAAFQRMTQAPSQQLP